MRDRYREHAEVSAAMMQSMNALQTWHDIVQAARAMKHVHLHFDLLDRECQRFAQEDCGGSSPDVAEKGGGDGR